MTVTDLKQQFVDHLASMDKNKMSMMDLSVYSSIVRTLLDTERPDFSASCIDVLKNIYASKADVCAEKEDANNG